MADRPVMLITGAGRGIGAAIARAAAAQRYHLVLNYSTSADAADELAAELRETGCRVVTVRADVADEADVVRMFATVDERFGRIDVLVNNAGAAGGYGPLDTVTADMLTRLWAVNISGPFLCSREAAARMRTDHGGRGGSIINISSKAAVLGGADEWVHYAASKGALDTMTVGLSKELANVGVRVNGVRPGLIESDFHLHAPPGRLERMAPTIPMQRSASAAEVAPAVMWLASPEADYVTGAFIDVTGGR
ncbi:MAG TPA: SDR family oxidoreductase [Ilumatobacteraceae bacterium]|nr:SDR family oxidoreductase [Ilumatobacteraceae bacterium]